MSTTLDDSAPKPTTSLQEKTDDTSSKIAAKEDCNATCTQPENGDSKVGSNQGTSKRKRPAACIHCHQRKVRCDARVVGIPCTNCRTSKRDDCRIHEKKKRAIVRSIHNPVPIRKAPPAPPVVPPVSTNLNVPQPNLSVTGKFLPQTPASFVPSAQHLTYNDVVFNTDSRLQQDSDESDAVQPENVARSELGKRLIKIIDEEDQNSPAIQQGIRVIYVGQDISNMNFLLRQQQLNQITSQGVHHYPANERPRQTYRRAIDQIPRDALELPPKPLADELVDAYFEHINPGCPIVDEEVFRAQYRGVNPEAPSCLLLQAIFLVGAHISKPKPERDHLKDMFYRRAKTLFEARVERNRDYMVQAALLLTWYSDPLDDDVTGNAHHWVGVAARIATGIGMHRNTASTRMVPSEKRMWRRVFWILYQFDVLVSLMHGRPQAINLEDCDVLSLTLDDFEGCGSHVQIDYVMHFTTLCTCISSIVRERFGLHVSPERRKLALHQADKALVHWSSRLPLHLCMTTTVNHSPDCWAARLHLVYHNFLILLHRPHPRADDYGANDAEICSASAGVIVSTLEDLRQRDLLKYLWVSSVNAIFTAMIQVRVELRFSNPLLSMNALGRFNSTMASLKVLAEYWITAETIMQLFKSSKRLQHDLKMLQSGEELEQAALQNGHRGTGLPGSANGQDKRNSIVSIASNGQAMPEVLSNISGLPLRPHFATNFEGSLVSGQPVVATKASQLQDTPEEAPPSFLTEPIPTSGFGTGIPPPVSAPDNVPATPPIPHLPTHHDYVNASCSPPDWHQLFNFVDAAGGDPNNGNAATTFPASLLPMDNFSEIETEWRDLYLNESGMPEITDYLGQEAGWMLG